VDNRPAVIQLCMNVERIDPSHAKQLADAYSGYFDAHGNEIPIDNDPFPTAKVTDSSLRCYIFHVCRFDFNGDVFPMLPASLRYVLGNPLFLKGGANANLDKKYLSETFLLHNLDGYVNVCKSVCDQNEKKTKILTVGGGKSLDILCKSIALKNIKWKMPRGATWDKDCDLTHDEFDYVVADAYASFVVFDILSSAEWLEDRTVADTTFQEDRKTICDADDATLVARLESVKKNSTSESTNSTAPAAGVGAKRRMPSDHPDQPEAKRNRVGSGTADNAENTHPCSSSTSNSSSSSGRSVGNSESNLFYSRHTSSG